MSPLRGRRRSHPSLLLLLPWEDWSFGAEGGQQQGLVQVQKARGWQVGMAGSSGPLLGAGIGVSPAAGLAHGPLASQLSSLCCHSHTRPRGHRCRSICLQSYLAEKGRK